MPNHRHRRHPPAAASIFLSLIVLAALSVVQLTRTTTRLGSSFRTTPTTTTSTNSHTTLVTTNYHTTTAAASVGKARANTGGRAVGQTEQQQVEGLAAATARRRIPTRLRQEAKRDVRSSGSAIGVADDGLKRSYEFPHAKPDQQPHHHQAAITDITDATPPFNLTAYSTLFLYHTRKAGGTTLRSFLASVASHHNLTFKVQEGKVFDPATKFDPSGRTFYVTSLRDPVERAVSSYWFEGRWSQKTPTRHCNDTNARNLTEWIAYTERRIERKTDAFVRRIAKRNARNITQSGNSTQSGGSSKRHSKQNKRKGVRIWGCASNCYTKWFGGWPTPDLTPNLTNAIATLERFHLIIHTERMKDESYIQNLARIMGVTTTTATNDDNEEEEEEDEGEEDEDEEVEEEEGGVAPLTHLRAQKSSSRKIKSNYTIPEEDMELLREMNRKDAELFRHFFGEGG